jgi:predicted flap endonuclease-1-like 5' DNA nuclease
MGTIISSIIVCLIIAALIGALIGWLLKAIFSGNQFNALEQEWQTRQRSYEQDLAKSRGEITSHLSELEVVRKDLSAQTDKVKSLQNTSGDHQSKVNSLTSELAAKASAFMALQNDISGLRSQLAEVQNDRDVNTGKWQSLQAEHQSLLPRYSSLESEHKALLSRFGSAESDAANLRKQLADAQTAQNSKTEEVKKLSGEMENLRREHAATKTEAASAALKLKEADALRPQITTLNAKLTARDQELQAARNDNKKIQDEHNAIQQQITDLNAKLSAREQELQTARNEGKKAKDEHSAASQQLAALKQTVQSHENNLGAQASKIMLLTSDLASKSSDHSNFEAESKTLRAQLSEAQAAAHKVAGKDTELENLRRQMQDRDNKIKSMEADTASRTTAKEAELESLRRQLAERDSRMKALESDALTRNSTHATLDVELKKLRATLAESHAALQAKNESLSRLETEMGPTKQRMAMRESEVAKLSAQLRESEPLRSQLSQRDEELNRLRPRLAEIDTLRLQVNEANIKVRDADTRLQAAVRVKEEELNRLRPRLAEIDGLRTQYNEANARLRDVDTRHQALLLAKEEEIARLRQRPDAVNNDDAWRTQVAQRDGRIRELEALLAQASTQRADTAPTLRAAKNPAPEKEESAKTAAPGKVATPARGEKDDLKLIFGIGPVLEKTLNKMDIYHFKQIANWSAADIERIDAQLVNFRGRIERDNWIKGAKQEHYKKYNERL